MKLTPNESSIRLLMSAWRKATIDCADQHPDGDFSDANIMTALTSFVAQVVCSTERPDRGEALAKIFYDQLVIYLRGMQLLSNDNVLKKEARIGRSQEILANAKGDANATA